VCKCANDSQITASSQPILPESHVSNLQMSRRWQLVDRTPLD
jgi:hypothetical protein